MSETTVPLVNTHVGGRCDTPVAIPKRLREEQLPVKCYTGKVYLVVR